MRARSRHSNSVPAHVARGSCSPENGSVLRRGHLVAAQIAAALHAPAYRGVPGAEHALFTRFACGSNRMDFAALERVPLVLVLSFGRELALTFRLCGRRCLALARCRVD